MNSHLHTNAKLNKALRLLCLAFIVFLSTPVLAQNTKGDRAETNGPRQNRFNIHKQKKSNPKSTFNRVTPHRFSFANAARSFSRSRRPSSSGKNVYSQRSFWVNNHQRKPSNNAASGGTSAYSRKSVKRPSGKSRNIYSQNGRFSNNPSRQPKNVQRAVSNRPTLARLNRMQSSPQASPPGRKKKVVPRSASSSFIRHKTINANAGFWNIRKKGEVAVLKDLAGRPLRTKNYQTPTPSIIAPTLKPALRRKRVGDHPYKVTGSGKHVSASRPNQQAWKGDIAGRKIRGKNYSSKVVIEGQPVFPRKKTRVSKGDKVCRGRMPGNGYKSASQPSEKSPGKIPLPVRIPGIGANGVGGYQGNLKLFEARPEMDDQGAGYSGNVKVRRPLKGGGSRSGRTWNNKGLALQGLSPGIGGDRVGTFQGNIKAQRPLKGGGSRSGKVWNNKGLALQGRSPGIGGDRVGTFQGNIKTQRPLKGGGSRSGKLWNNKGLALQGRSPGIGADRIGTFQGNMKANRPLKGGGSISGKVWNNREQALQGRSPGIGADRIGTFQGNIKAHRPLHGGGSISGKVWNNNQVPVSVRGPSSGAAKAGGFPGNIKRFELSPGFNNQGEEFTGYTKTKKPLKGGGSVSGKLWNNKELPIPVRGPSSEGAKASGFPGNIKQFELSPGFNNQGEEFTGFIKLPVFKRSYLKNPNDAEGAIRKKRPDKTTYDVAGLQVKVKRREYVVNKNSAEEALKKLKPTDATQAVGNLQIKVKQYNYIHNASSVQDALNVREPGKAFARATDYQGNIKMKKIDLTKIFSQKNRELHPDAQFVKINKNNVASERDLITNIKLWWAHTFRKNETQPDNLKEKERKPRYDKGEQGLWNE